VIFFLKLKVEYKEINNKHQRLTATPPSTARSSKSITLRSILRPVSPILVTIFARPVAQYSFSSAVERRALSGSRPSTAGTDRRVVSGLAVARGVVVDGWQSQQWTGGVSAVRTVRGIRPNVTPTVTYIHSGTASQRKQPLRRKSRHQPSRCRHSRIPPQPHQQLVGHARQQHLMRDPVHPACHPATATRGSGGGGGGGNCSGGGSGGGRVAPCRSVPLRRAGKGAAGDVGATAAHSAAAAPAATATASATATTDSGSGSGRRLAVPGGRVRARAPDLVATAHVGAGTALHNGAVAVVTVAVWKCGGVEVCGSGNGVSLFVCVCVSE
jgi:hypothetical protein